MVRVSIWDSTYLNLITLSKDPSFTVFYWELAKLLKIYFTAVNVKDFYSLPQYIFGKYWLKLVEISTYISKKVGKNQ